MDMSAPKGNQYWKNRPFPGRKPDYTPEQLWDSALDYFQWVENYPLMEEELFSYQGIVIRAEKAKMRAMTFDGLWIHLDISHTTWQNYRKREEYVAVIDAIESTIKDQKFTGAAAGLLNANIIARDLGLNDNFKHELIPPPPAIIVYNTGPELNFSDEE